MRIDRLKKLICVALSLVFFCSGMVFAAEEGESSFVPATDGAGGFVNRMYTVVLNRPAEEDGYNAWLRVLLTGEDNGAGVARDFLLSQEFINRNLSNEEYVTVLYNLFFDRAPDQAGFEAWVAQLQRGVPVSEILAGFVNSTEWANTCVFYGIESGGTGVPTVQVSVTPTSQAGPVGFDNPAPTETAATPTAAPSGTAATVTPGEGVTQGMIQFVQSLYSECLGRDASATEINGWTEVLANGSNTGKQVAYGFFFSNEFLAKSGNMTDEQLVTVFYKVFLNRQPDGAGLESWCRAIEWADKVPTLFSGFADSSEFARKCESYGVVCGDHIDVLPSNAVTVEPEFLEYVQNYDIQRGIERIDSATPGERHTEFTVYNVQGMETETRVHHMRQGDIDAIERFASEHFLPGWSNGMKLAYTAWWINRNVTYSGAGSWGYAEAIFVHQKGQCAQYNGAMIEMMCLMGYDVSMIQGFRMRSNGNTFQHFWGEVNLNGSVYVIENGNMGDSGNWHYFICLYSETTKFVKNGSVVN
ncbi:MAG: DUF4214 domain-containing protein [Clostridiales bacterium]|nr:DUF4214 domain-containing protein [Clostridiales bacterium]